MSPRCGGPKFAGGGGTALATRVETALSPPEAIVPISYPAEFAVHVLNLEGGTKLVAAVELVSPANKERPEHRRMFAAKCLELVSRGVGLIVVDIVTSRQSRPFDELMALIRPGGPTPATGPLTAASYRPVRIDDTDSLEIRVRTLELGGPLPELPLALAGFGHLLLDLDATYDEVCSKFKIS